MTNREPADVDWAAHSDVLLRLAPKIRGLGLPPYYALAVKQAAALCDLRVRERVPLDEAATPTIPVARVCVESPLRGDYARNASYADACMLDCFERDEAPFLGHVTYPRVLNDEDPEDRARGIAAHLTWLRMADFVAMYIDLGVSSGMQHAGLTARAQRVPVVERTLGTGWLERLARKRPTKGF